MKKSIKTRLVIYNVSVIVVLVSILGGLSFYSFNEYLWENGRSKLEENIHHVNEEIYHFIQSKKSVIDRLSERKIVKDYSNTYRYSVLKEHLSIYKNEFPVISYVNENGEEELKLINGNESKETDNYKNSPVFTATRKKPNKVLVFPVENSRELNVPVFKMAIFRYNYFGDEFAGMIVVTIPFKKIEEILKKDVILEKEFIVILDSSANILYSSINGFHSSNIGGEGGVSNILKSKYENRGKGFFRSELLGIDALIAYEAVELFEWTLFLAMPYKEFVSYPNKVRNYSIVAFLIASLFGWLMISVISRNITSPLERLSQSAYKIADGEPLQDIEIDTYGEIQELVDSFNQMIVDLRKTTISRDYMDRIVSSMSESLIVTSPDGVIERANIETCRMLGYREDELIGMSLDSILTERKMSINKLIDYLSYSTSLFKEEYKYLTKNGESVPVILSVSQLRDRDKAPTAIICLAFDIRERIKTEEQIRYLAYCDKLTGLPNRTVFIDRLSAVAEYADRYKKKAAVLFIDIDNFKKVNDSLGHNVGDMLLKQIVGRLQVAVRESDVVARNSEDLSGHMLSRLGGDEFTILLSEVDRHIDAAPVAQRIIEDLKQPFIIFKQELFVTASIGISLYPFDSKEPDELIKYADIAMYKAKASGKNNYKFFEQSMNLEIIKRHDMESRLRKALHKQEFVLHYQPLLDLRNRKIIGVEALIRWDSPELGFVSPVDFIPVAEETGFINQIGDWVLDTSCKQIKKWQSEGVTSKSVSVNVSGIQFKQLNFVEKVLSIVKVNDMDPNMLILEITESVMMDNKDTAAFIINKLRENGIKFVIDDFGTGYSSLSYLKQFPLHAIKIDRSFMTGVSKNNDDASIVEAIIKMAHSLKMKVVAEGIETEGQLLFLHHMNCDEAQGFLISKPQPADKITPVLLERKVISVM